MSTIRFRKTTAPSSTPADTSKLFVDEVDNHLKRRLDDGSLIDYDSAISTEAIQDAIGSALADTATIDLDYDDIANAITAAIVPSSINDSHIYQISPVKIGDAQNENIQASINTTTNSPATALTLDCSDDGVLLVNTKITCYRTGGTAGSPGDSATFERSFRIKSIAGVVSIHDIQSDYTSKDIPQMNVQFIVSGTDVNFRVIGVTNVNLRWKLDASINKNT